MEQVMQQLLNEMKSLRSEVSIIKTEVGGLKAGNQEIKADISGLKAGNQEIKADLGAIKTDNKNIKPMLVGIQADVIELKDGQKRLESRLENTRKISLSLLATTQKKSSIKETRRPQL